MHSLNPETKNPRMKKVIPWFIKRNKWVKKFVKGKIVLDAPCGSGWGMSIYAPVIKRGEGIDLDQEAIDYAQRHYLSKKLNFRLGDIRSMPYPNNEFDAVVGFETLEHLIPSDGQKYLNEIYRVLKPGGLYIGSTPDTKTVKTIRTPPDPSKNIQGHICLYSEQYLKRQLSIFTKCRFYTNVLSWAFVWVCSKPTKKKISIIILSLDRSHKTERCLLSIKRHTQVPYQIIIVDNGSPHKHTINKLMSLKAMHNEYVISYLGKNIGVGQGRQYGLQFVTGDYVVFLDNDMVVTDNWDIELLKRIETLPQAGAVCCKVIHKEKNVVQLNGRKIKEENGKFFIDYSYDNLPLDDPRANEEMECHIIHGGPTIFKKEVLNKVAYDPKYFVGADDLDLAMQIKQNGWKLYNCPKSIVYHFPDKMYSEQRKDKKLIRESYLYFRKKWGIYA